MNKMIKPVTIALMCGIVFSAGCGKTNIDLNKYVTVEVSGYDGYGEADVDFDLDALRADYDDKLKYKGDDELTAAIFEEDPAGALYDDCISRNVVNKSELSNGDTVKVEWKCKDERALEKYNVKLSYSDIEYEVEGLEVIPTFDPFEDISVSFSGISGEGRIDINSDSSNGIRYSADKSFNLSEGDKITITADVGNAKSYAEKYGRMPSVTTKEYTAEGFDTYFISVEAVNKDDVRSVISSIVNKSLNEFLDGPTRDAEEAGLLDEPKYTWEVKGEITKDPQIVDIYIGNSKAGDNENVLYIISKAGYKYTVTKNWWTSEVMDDVIGEGDAYFGVEIKDSIISGGELSLGKASSKVRVSKDIADFDVYINSLKADSSFDEADSSFSPEASTPKDPETDDKEVTYSCLIDKAVETDGKIKITPQEGWGISEVLPVEISDEMYQKLKVGCKPPIDCEQLDKYYCVEEKDGEFYFIEDYFKSMDELFDECVAYKISKDGDSIKMYGRCLMGAYGDKWVEVTSVSKQISVKKDFYLTSDTVCKIIDKIPSDNKMENVKYKELTVKDIEEKDIYSIYDQNKDGYGWHGITQVLLTVDESGNVSKLEEVFTYEM